jgi:hypothetical protein
MRSDFNRAAIIMSVSSGVLRVAAEMKRRRDHIDLNAFSTIVSFEIMMTYYFAFTLTEAYFV